MKNFYGTIVPFVGKEIYRAFVAKKKLFLFCFAMMASVGSLLANEGSYDGIYYNFFGKYLGYHATVIAPYNNHKYSGTIIIPSTVRHSNYDNSVYTVTEIEKSAFSGCPDLISITIPNSVTSIGQNAFNNVPNIEYNGTATGSPWGARSVNGYVEGWLVYSDTMKTNLLACSAAAIGEITIPNSVTSIGQNAFYKCTGLTSINIPTSVTSIGEYAFSGCTGLTSISIPNSVTSIEKSVFSSCSNLTSITIPNSVTSIGNSAFSGCNKLTSVTIPSSVTSIGNEAFSEVFNIVYYGTATGSSWGARSMNGYIDDWFVYSDETKTALLTCSIDATGYITIPNSVMSIENNAFSSCSKLTSITIPNSVMSIGNKAFYGCSKLTSITIGNGVTSIGGSAFYNCTQLNKVYITDLAAWCSITFADESKYTNSNPLMYAHHLYLYEIGREAQEITKLVIPEDVTKITSNAFSGCSSLTSVSLPNSVTSIGNYAFSGCTGLTSVSIPNSVTSIGNYAFCDCSSLTSVAILNTVTSIGESAFSGCTGLTSVHISDLAAWCNISFGSSIANPLRYAHKLYLNGELVTDLVIPNSVTSIENYAFSGCTGLTSVSIPNSVTSIGDEAFAYCTGLTSVTIPNSATSIGERAFQSCTDLTSVTIGNSITSIVDCAFQQCSSLTSVYISDLAAWCNISFGSSDANPLYYAHKLYLNGELVTDLVIPNSVTSIGNYAFSGCTGLTSVSIPNSVTSIGQNAFSGCTGLTSVSIPNSVTSIGNWAFKDCGKLTSVICDAEVPPTINSNVFSTNPIIYVPFGTRDSYIEAKGWKNYIIRVIGLQTKEDELGPTSIAVTFGSEKTQPFISSCGIDGQEGNTGNVFEWIGLEPENDYTNVPLFIKTISSDYDTIHYSFKTSALTLTTQPSKPVSSTTAILLAETNMVDIETSCGFEWKRNDMPDDYAGTKVFCPVANGTMAGRLKNLKDDVLYKYRAFYQSAAGNMYYGDWQYIFTGDVAVEFDPILYTYAAASVKESEATLKGYALAGSTDFTEQGFEYWSESRVPHADSAPHRIHAALGEHHNVTASGISMKATLTNLDAGTVYKYRTYAKIGDLVLYGTEMTFTTQGEYVPPTYVITFVNWDGTELLRLPEVEEETLPVYTGETPLRAEDEQYTYTFIGWSPAIVAAIADATYTATYEATPKSQGFEGIRTEDSAPHKILRNGQILILRGGKAYTITGQEVR